MSKRCRIASGAAGSRLSDSLELRKAVVLIVIVYYSERTEIKISSNDWCTGQNPGETRCFLFCLPVKAYRQHINFQNQYGLLGKFTRASVSRVFIGDSHIGMVDRPHV